MKRDLYIDFAKGIATICIIFIHTAFWSGQFYIPTPVRVFSLLWDVPLFFALSGLTSGNNLEKTFYRLLKLQITYMIFVTALFFADYFFKIFVMNFWGSAKLNAIYSVFGSKYAPSYIPAFPQWENLGNWYLHSYTMCDTFPVVMGSFWYLKVYYILTVFGVLALKFFPRHIHLLISICFALTVFFNIFPQYYPSGEVGYVAFYLGLFLLAGRLRGKKLSTKFFVSAIAIWLLLFGVLFWKFGADFFLSMNKSKFPPKMPYIFWSGLSLTILFGLYNRLKINKENIMTFIGRNAIFFYFAQGISSSLMYFLVSPLKSQMPWYILIVVIFLANVICAYFIALFLKFLDKKGWEILQFIRKKTAI